MPGTTLEAPRPTPAGPEHDPMAFTATAGQTIDQQVEAGMAHLDTDLHQVLQDAALLPAVDAPEATELTIPTIETETGREISKRPGIRKLARTALIGAGIQLIGLMVDSALIAGGKAHIPGIQSMFGKK